MVDDDPRPGRFFLTGSNQPLLKAQIVQSLAGRAGYVHQLPFSAWELGDHATPAHLDEWLFKGFYPPLYDRPFLPLDWFAQYVATYLERDLRQLIQVKDLRAFQRFLSLCAGRTGQILNLSNLARDADISHTTVKHWLSALEASYLIFFLPPWHENYQKRLVKSPKLYFYDCGLAGYLAGISSAVQITVSEAGSQWIFSAGGFSPHLVSSMRLKNFRPSSTWVTDLLNTGNYNRSLPVLQQENWRFLKSLCK